MLNSPHGCVNTIESNFMHYPKHHELHHRIVEECDALRERPVIIRRAVQDMHRRTRLCVTRNGGHVEGQGP